MKTAKIAAVNGGRAFVEAGISTTATPSQNYPTSLKIYNDNLITRRVGQAFLDSRLKMANHQGLKTRHQAMADNIHKNWTTDDTHR